MPTYDNRSNPPAPFALVTIRNVSANKSSTDVPMLLDTGADVSLIPRVLVEALNLTQTQTDFRLSAFDGAISTANSAEVELEFLNKTFRGAFLLMDENYGIIGRDILNLVSLHFDGPNLVWSER